MLPVGDPGKQDLIEVLQDRRERLGILGRARRKPGTDLTGADLREHRQLADALEVPRRPLECGRSVTPKIGQTDAGVGVNS